MSAIDGGYLQVDERCQCQICGWSVSTQMGGTGWEEEEELLWKGAAVLHGLLRHPREHYLATGCEAEPRLASYKEQCERIHPDLFPFLYVLAMEGDGGGMG